MPLLQKLMTTIFDNLHLESSDDEITAIVEANLVEAQIRFNNRGSNKIREQLYVNEIIPRFNNEVFHQHFCMIRNYLRKSRATIISGIDTNK